LAAVITAQTAAAQAVATFDDRLAQAASSSVDVLGPLAAEAAIGSESLDLCSDTPMSGETVG